MRKWFLSRLGYSQAWQDLQIEEAEKRGYHRGTQAVEEKIARAALEGHDVAFEYAGQTFFFKPNLERNALYGGRVEP